MIYIALVCGLLSIVILVLLGVVIVGLTTFSALLLPLGRLILSVLLFGLSAGVDLDWAFSVILFKYIYDGNWACDCGILLCTFPEKLFVVFAVLMLILISWRWLDGAFTWLRFASGIFDMLGMFCLVEFIWVWDWLERATELPAEFEFYTAWTPVKLILLLPKFGLLIMFWLTELMFAFG